MPETRDHSGVGLLTVAPSSLLLKRYVRSRILLKNIIFGAPICRAISILVVVDTVVVGFAVSHVK